MQLPRIRNYRNWIKATTFLLAVPITALQFVHRTSEVNPPVFKERTIEANLQLTPEVSGIINRACADCHSNQTRWPWYSRVAPMSWPIAADVHNARSAMNFSEWSTGIGRKPTMAVSALAAACANVEAGTMPLPRYLLLHPSARLTDADRRTFCDWTRAETARLMAERRSALMRR